MGAPSPQLYLCVLFLILLRIEHLTTIAPPQLQNVASASELTAAYKGEGSRTLEHLLAENVTPTAGSRESPQRSDDFANGSSWEDDGGTSSNLTEPQINESKANMVKGEISNTGMEASDRWRNFSDQQQDSRNTSSGHSPNQATDGDEEETGGHLTRDSGTQASSATSLDADHYKLSDNLNHKNSEQTAVAENLLGRVATKPKMVEPEISSEKPNIKDKNIMEKEENRTVSDDSSSQDFGIQDCECEEGEIGGQGEKGETGAEGPAGPKGPRGHRGEKGDMGINGTDGLPGPQGVKGDRGYTGYAGYQGDQEGFLPQPCIECPTGAAGPPGPPGKDGEPGLPGEPGLNGTDGQPGPHGRRGRKGDVGDAGPPGSEGPSSINNCTCKRGPKGDRGSKGNRGLIGFIGYKGESGPPGPPGPPGEGMEGPAGPPGLTGPQGPRGMRGDRGEKGEPGRRFVAGSNLLLLTSTPEPTTTAIPTTTEEPTVEPRTKTCRLRMVGKPLFQRYISTFYGAWMRDPYPPESGWGADKVWFTRHFTGKFLTEYSNFENFRHAQESHKYQLTDMYFGTGHVIYEAAFYYHHAGQNKILKYDLQTERVVTDLVIPGAVYQGKETTYSTDYTFFDLAVDENGLWVIYSSQDNTSVLMVSKLDHVDLTIQKTWKIQVDHHRYGNGFITCGVLYLVENTQSKTTAINFAYDLYKKEVVDGVRLKFTNPFQMNNMLAYNPREKKIYSWDKGNVLTYPLLL